MKLDAEFFTTSAGQWTLLTLALLTGAAFVLWQYHRREPVLADPVRTTLSPIMPHVFTRNSPRIAETRSTPLNRVTYDPAVALPAASTDNPKPEPSAVSPLTLTFVASLPTKVDRPAAPFGRLIPCETIVTLESNRLETPVIGLVTEDVWHGGRIVIPKGAEVHGRASLDHVRERIAATGTWVIVWRTTARDNGTELTVQGMALDRTLKTADGNWGDQDGSAGLRGTVVKTQDDRELKLFAATFLGAATAALQDIRPSAGLLGATGIPAATVRNATLAGMSAILRDQAQQIREAIARDGFYVRVPSGKPFYLYVTETLNIGNSRLPPARP